MSLVALLALGCTGSGLGLPGPSARSCPDGSCLEPVEEAEEEAPRVSPELERSTGDTGIRTWTDPPGTTTETETCVPVPEQCGNGADDDCDGAIDCHDSDCDDACFSDCTDTEGGNCNGDMGYGDHCAPADNTGGCSDERFWAWCNRRNPATPDIWDDHLRTWVDDRCDGSITLQDRDGNGYEEYTCEDSDGSRWWCTTPLVLRLELLRPVALVPDAGTALFDLAPAGARPIVRVDWPTAATPWLARDRDGDGAITSGRELFGSATPLADGPAEDGFAALASLDADGDGDVDADDPAYADLVLWADLDGDRRSAAHELRSLTRAGIVRLSVRPEVRTRCDARGNCARERAPVTWRDAAGVVRTGELVDVHLRNHGAGPGPS